MLEINLLRVLFVDNKEKHFNNQEAIVLHLFSFPIYNCASGT